MGTKTLTNAEAVALDQKTQAGVTKYLGSVKVVTLAGQQTTAAKINAIFQADVDATSALDEALADVKQKRATQKAARAAAVSTRADLKSYILGNYGEQAVQMLEDCGISAPKKPGAKTVASKAQAVAASKATRAAGGTKAKKAKAQAAAEQAVVAVAATPPATK